MGRRCLTLTGPAHELDRALGLCDEAMERNKSRDRSGSASSAAKAQPLSKQEGGKEAGKGKQGKEGGPAEGRGWHWGEHLQRRSTDHEPKLAEHDRQLRGLSIQVHQLAQTSGSQQAL